MLHLVLEGGERGEDCFALGDMVIVLGGKVGDCAVDVVDDLRDDGGPSFPHRGVCEGQRVAVVVLGYGWVELHDWLVRRESGSGAGW